MSSSWQGKFAPIHRALTHLEEVLARPVVLLAAGWHDPYRVVLTEEASRRLIDLYMHLPEAEAVPIFFLYARGCTTAFTDALRRSQLPFHAAYVANRTLGATTAAALCARSLVLLPGAGLGACDHVDLWAQPNASLLTTPAQIYQSLSHEERASVLDSEAPPHTRHLILSLARARQEQALGERLLAAVLSSHHFDREQRDQVMELVEALSTRRLGESLALGTRELSALGVQARGPVESQELEAAMGLCAAIERQFAVSPRARKLFEDNELGEVEFELATGEPGALIASKERAHFFELDTGSPDPDSGLLAGSWSKLGA